MRVTYFSFTESSCHIKFLVFSLGNQQVSVLKFIIISMDKCFRTYYIFKLFFTGILVHY